MGGAKRIQLWRAVHMSILKSDNNHLTIIKILVIFKNTPVIFKLQSYRAFKSFTKLLNDISKQLGDARPPLGNAPAKTHCGKNTGHTAHMAKGDTTQ